MSYASQNTASTLPQGFSIYQPTLGAQLQFLPAIGTPELDELINAYVTGPATTQEKRASVSLDFLEYAHVTGQTFKFYPVYSMNTAVESPATDSGYGSSFNVSPVTSNWDFSQISTSRSPPSQQARRSPKAAPSRQQTTDFSNLPGMKIMTKDGLDVTNSASRGSKTKEQRDHAHLMRIIKACDNCKRKKIRCDPSHKKRAVAQSQSQSAAKSTKKAKVVAQAVQAATAPPAPVNVPVSAPNMALDQTWASIDLESFDPSLSALEPWEEFVDYAPVEDYDFFNDPAGYFSPEASSSSSVSAYSTKPVTPTSQQELSAPYDLLGGNATVASPQLPFNQTDPTNDYVDFNLFSPGSSFSEDEQMVPIDVSQHLRNRSSSPQSSQLQSDQSSGGIDVVGGLEEFSPDTLWFKSPRQSGEDERGASSTYYDPGASDGGQQQCSPSSSGESSDAYSHLGGSLELSDRLKAPSSGGVATAPSSRSVAVGLDESSIRRGTYAIAEVIANSEHAVGQTGEDHNDVDVYGPSSDVRSPDTYGKRRRRMDISAQASPQGLPGSSQNHVAPDLEAAIDQDAYVVDTGSRTITTEAFASENAVPLKRTEARDADYSENAVVAKSGMPQQPQTCAPCAPCARTVGGELTSMKTSAALATTTHDIQSCVENFLATMVPAMITLAALGSLFESPNNGQQPLFMSKEKLPMKISTTKAKKSFAFLRNASLQSCANGTVKPVGGMMSRNSNLIAV